MYPHSCSSHLRLVWRPCLWVICMVLMFGGIQAYVPSLGNTPKHIKERSELAHSTALPSVPPTTQTNARSANKSKYAVSKELAKPHEVLDGTFEDNITICEYKMTRTECLQELLSICSQNFKQTMHAMNSIEWCMWEQVKSPYNTFSMCTESMAESLALPWPSKLVEETFVSIHSLYFQNCSTETLKDPPPNVVFALVMTPICLIPAMVVLVVLKTKNGDKRS